MATLTVTKRGLVTLPEELLHHIGVQPGEKIELTLLPDGQIGVSAVRLKGTRSSRTSVPDRELL